MDSAWHETVRRRLAERRPASLLNVGPLGETLFRDYLEARPDTAYRSFEPREALAELPRLPRFAQAFVAGAFETLSKEEAVRLLARLRDVHAEHLFLAVDSGRASATELLALGLQRLEEHRDSALYEFDIARYKLTPDWLNSNHWAHPELFDKFRW